MPRLFALCDGEACEPTVFSGCAPLGQRAVQPAGRAFKDKFERRADSEDDDDRKASKQSASGSDEGESPTKKKEKKQKKDQEALKLAECLKGEDLYALLEVEAGASQEDMKKAYRKICLTHHPDKAGADKTGAELEAVNEYFVKLQECFAVLSDMKKRRKYDSMGEFDDSVPTKLKEGQDFFQVFDEVFKRNAKFSEQNPVPQLGNMDTPYEKVKSFYDFWFAFDSWRDLDAQIMEENGEDCFQDLEDADCRDEKRWMEKENASVRKKYMKAERQRVFGFVETAEKLDPRVRAEKDKQFAEREAAKLAKEAKRVEAERIAQEEQDLKDAAEEVKKAAAAVEKAQREEEKQVRKNKRSALRTNIKDLSLGLAEHSLQEFLLALDNAETDALTEELSKKMKNKSADKRDEAKGEAVLAAMNAKGVEPVILRLEQEDKSTEEGETSEEVTLSPQEAAKLKKEQEQKQKKDEAKRKLQEVEDNKIKEVEAAKRAEEKAVRDVKKKAEQEKKDKEAQKSNKKEADKVKREQEKKVKDEEKAVEKARAEKEANLKRSEEMKLKQSEENKAEKEAKFLEKKTFDFERDRLARVETFEKLEWTAVVEASQAATENSIIASGLAAAAYPGYEDPEDLLDAQLSCLGSYFVLGIRPAEDSYPLSSGLRSKIKKLRSKIRTAAAAGEFALLAPAGTKADNEALEQMELAATGEVSHPAEVAAAAAVAEVAEAAPASEAAGKAKKKKATKAAPAGDEDLDALLEEFGMTGNGEGKKKKGGKKK